MVIALDGPASSGKSTLAVKLAEIIGYNFLNTGMIYRALAYALLKNNIDINNKPAVAHLLEEIDVKVEYVNGEQIIYIDNEDTSSVVNDVEIAEKASTYSQCAIVRERAKVIQQNFAKKYNLVVEGRDIGTEIFPDAKHKFFVVASIEARAKRRFLTLKEKYPNITLEKVKQSLIQRDYNDTHRELCPLKQAKDAILIDTTNDTIQDSINKLLFHINKTK